MNIGQVIYMVASILVYLFIVVSCLYGIHAVYYAYFKTKDERQKLIVLRSTAHAFGILMAYFLLQTLVLVARAPQLTHIWNLLHFNIDGAISFGMLAALGVCLFVNKRRAGGG